MLDLGSACAAVLQVQFAKEFQLDGHKVEQQFREQALYAEKLVKQVTEGGRSAARGPVKQGGAMRGWRGGW